MSSFLIDKMRNILFLFNFLVVLTTNAIPTSNLVQLGSKILHFNATKSLNFYQADLACHQINMTLVTINSAEEHNNIVRHIQENDYYGSFWTAGNDLAYEGEFHWLSNGKIIEYTNWEDGEPNNLPNGKETENCIVMHHGFGYRWDDVACKARFYHFICEIL